MALKGDPHWSFKSTDNRSIRLADLKYCLVWIFKITMTTTYGQCPKKGPALLVQEHRYQVSQLSRHCALTSYNIIEWEITKWTPKLFVSGYRAPVEIAPAMTAALASSRSSRPLAEVAGTRQPAWTAAGLRTRTPTPTQRQTRRSTRSTQSGSIRIRFEETASDFLLRWATSDGCPPSDPRSGRATTRPRRRSGRWREERTASALSTSMRWSPMGYR